MARNNTISATFQMAAGDSASGFTESTSGASFTSGDAVKIEGTISNSGATVYDVDNYGIPQADGVYFENRDSTNYVTLILKQGDGTVISTLLIAPKGVFMVRTDTDQAGINQISLQADTAPCEFVLCLAE